MKIGVLGPEGTFSEKAARKWNSRAEIRYFEDISDVLEAAQKGEIDSGIVPVENSIEGSIGMTLDYLLEYDVKVTGEVVIPVKHCLLGRRGEDIRVILSHPQALAQCRKHLKSMFPGAELRAVESTARAAEMAAKARNTAAIASEESARRYGLTVLEHSIADMKENFTRFLVIGKQFAPPGGSDKTSIIVYLDENRPGALYDLLGEFARRSIDLTKIESRPSKKALGDYLFYIDFKGHFSDPLVREAIENVKQKTGMLKLLGSFRTADSQMDV
ncbi:MAG TPA: prephenate dehydratase [Candidatus Methanoperedenaceae archaeon]|nr:prephenate dehydratase [Candidatus Methanoperedenaceae archaeon]